MACKVRVIFVATLYPRRDPRGINNGVYRYPPMSSLPNDVGLLFLRQISAFARSRDDGRHDQTWQLPKRKQMNPTRHDQREYCKKSKGKYTLNPALAK